MDHNMSSNAKFNFLRMTFKVLVSVSVFSFVISQYSSLILPLLLNSADEFSSSFSVNQLFRYSSERNYVFLLCNGILVLIITNSGLIATPPRSHDSHRERAIKVVELKIAEEEEERKKGDETHEKVIFIHHHHHQEEEEEESKKTVTFTDHHHHHHQEEERKKGDGEIVQIYSDHHHHEEEVEAEENEIGDDEEEDRLSNEELNKKCEEFIKRMKQSIIMRN